MNHRLLLHHFRPDAECGDKGDKTRSYIPHLKQSRYVGFREIKRIQLEVRIDGSRRAVIIFVKRSKQLLAVNKQAANLVGTRIFERVVGHAKRHLGQRLHNLRCGELA